MALLLFPSEGQRYVQLPGGSFAAGRTGVLYAQDGATLATVYADNGGVPGSAISGSTFTLDANGGQPNYWFDGDWLYARFNGGPLVRIDAAYDPRIDAALPLAGGTLVSTAAGGGNTSDSTGRITLPSYQRAVNPNHFGEVLRADLMAPDAKAMVAWREGYTGNGLRTVAWTGAHGQSNDGLSWHNHWSVEVPDLTGALQSALEVPYATWNVANGFGISASDVYVRAIAKLIAGPLGLYVEASGGTNRDLNFGTIDGSNIGGVDAYRRWTLRADSTTESGSNVGSDFAIARRTDGGVVLDAPFFIKRSTGFVGIGGVNNPGVALDVGPGTGTVAARVNRGASAFGSITLATAGTDNWSIQLRNDATGDLHVRNAVQGLTAILVENRATAPNLSLLTSTKSYGGGVGVVFVPNASTVPGTNPAGGVVLYAEGGALKCRGSSGTVTTIAAA